MDINLKSPLTRYAAAVFLAAVGVAARFPLIPLIGAGSPFITLFPVIAVSGLIGGIGPGIVTTVICAGMAAYLFIEPGYSLSAVRTEDAVQVLIFLLMGGFISWVADQRRRARTELLRVETEAEKQSIEAAAALRESEERSRLAQSAVGVGVWEWDLSTNEVQWSEGIYRLVGLDEASKGSVRNWSDLILDEDRDVAIDSIRTLIDEGSPNFYGEFRIRRLNDGRIRWLATQGRIIREDGKPVRLLGVNFDITETKESELKIQNLNRELNRRVRELQTIIELAPVGIAVAQDASCDMILANPALAEIVGMTPGDNVSLNRRPLPYRHFSNGRELRADELPMQRAVATKKAILNEEIEIERADGSRVTVYCFAAPILDEDDNVLGCVAAQVDVTEQKQYEREREQKLGEETHLRRQAEEANRLKDEFLATVSHELRTPLNSIIGWTSVLKERGSVNELQERAVSAIDRGARSQIQLIEDLLDVSRIISGKMQIESVPVDLSKVIAAAIETVKPAAESKQIILVQQIDPDTVPLLGDFDRLQQVVWNLLSNSIKFTPEDGRIDISLRQTDTELVLVVSDNGSGITEDFLPFVFDRFRQADGSITRSFAGLGLGLSIVKHIVELHGGTIGVRSEGRNKGATFTVTLPKAPSIVAPDDAQSPNGKTSVPELKGRRILVVEDEPDTREVLRLAFEKCRADVETSATASEALDLVKTWQPDAIVSDIGMSGKDGYTFMREVREWETSSSRRPALTVALTAYAHPDDRERAIDAGFHTHVPKPVEPLELARVVYDLLKLPTD